MKYLRPNVEAMSGYVPGEQPRSIPGIIKLNTNENPYPPSPLVRQELIRELGDSAESLRLYSDPAGTALRDAASKRFDLSTSQIIHGNGSDELIALLFRAIISPGDTVAYPYPNYLLYETMALAADAVIHRPPFDRQFALPESLFGSLARLVFVSSPNAPSGIAHGIPELRRLALSLAGGLLVIDEAYVDFAENSALPLVDELPNVVVLRTFSKSYSLAGMRVALMFAAEPIIAGIAKIKDSYNLDRLALVAAAAALTDNSWMLSNVAKIQRTRMRLSVALMSRGLEVLPSEANFILMRLAEAAEAKRVYEALRARNVFVRYFPFPLLDDALRVTVGTDADIDAFLAHLDAIL